MIFISKDGGRNSLFACLNTACEFLNLPIAVYPKDIFFQSKQIENSPKCPHLHEKQHTKKKQFYFIPKKPFIFIHPHIIHISIPLNLLHHRPLFLSKSINLIKFDVIAGNLNPCWNEIFMKETNFKWNNEAIYVEELLCVSNRFIDNKNLTIVALCVCFSRGNEI